MQKIAFLSARLIFVERRHSITRAPLCRMLGVAMGEGWNARAIRGFNDRFIAANLRQSPLLGVASLVMRDISSDRVEEFQFSE